MKSRALAFTFAALVFGALLFAATPAHALIIDSTYGVKGFAGGNLWTNPNKGYDATNGVSVAVSHDGSGFAGWGGGFASGFGAYYDLRVAKFVGVEIDILWDSSELYRDIDVNASSKRESITGTSIHIPMLAKAWIPLGLSWLTLGIGPEFVFPLSVSSESAWLPIEAVETKSTMLAMDLGMVFSVGPVEVPFSLRASKNLSQTIEWTDRVSIPCQASYPAPGCNSDNVYKVNAQNSWEFRLMLGVGFSL